MKTKRIAPIEILSSYLMGQVIFNDDSSHIVERVELAGRSNKIKITTEQGKEVIYFMDETIPIQTEDE